MGGTDSKEFSAIADIGEDTIAYSDDSDYSANLEMAASKMDENPVEDKKEMEEVDTPNVHTIDALAQLLKVDASRIMKAVAYIADEKPVMVMIRGDRKSTRLNSSHVSISYAVFCLTKKKQNKTTSI